jgi:hypothetical protein
MQKFSSKRIETPGCYLYAIVLDGGDRSFGPLGINGGEVYTVSERNLAAVVSDLPSQRIRPERRHFAAHQAVLKKVMENGDLLPMSFGVVSEGPEAIRRILARNRKAFLSQLKKVHGKIEMGLRVAWDVPNIFEYMVNIHPELMDARDRLLNAQHPPSQEEKIQVGRMFEDLLNSDRRRHTDLVERTLRPRCFEVKRNKCRDEREVMNLALLVGRDAVPEFENGVLQAASFFDDNFAFDYNGPWAPHNFVEAAVIP